MPESDLKMMQGTKTIGIIGGMGPAATVDLFDLIVENTQAACDQEHIHILIDNNSAIPDRTEAILHGTASPVKELCASAERLASAGADFLIIACNTAHYYIGQIREKVSIPVLDMIEETALYVRKAGFRSAVILCTEGARKTGIFTERFEKHGVNVIYPDHDLQTEVNRIIYDGVKGGKQEYVTTRFQHALHQVVKETGAVPVLGCTELPIAQKKYHLQGEYINPSYVLACSAISEAGYRQKNNRISNAGTDLGEGPAHETVSRH